MADRHGREAGSDEGGEIRKVDVLGRVVIPASIRKRLDLKEGGELMITTKGRSIILRPTAGACAFCDATDKLIKVGDGYEICREHAGEIASQLGATELKLVGG